jgi:uncharacterized membrane protein
MTDKVPEGNHQPKPQSDPEPKSVSKQDPKPEKTEDDSCSVEEAFDDILAESGFSELQGAGEIRKLPKEEKKSLILQYFTRLHQGPLPDPHTLKQYNEIIPNGADRVMKMAENQSAHRIEIEKIVINSQTKESKRGQVFALTIGIVIIVGGVTCILLKHEWSGSIISTIDIVGLVSVFLAGKKSQQRDLKEKAKND